MFGHPVKLICIHTYMHKLKNNEQVWLSGYSRHPQRPWLINPILNVVPGSKEHLYTQKHVQVRNCIDRCFELLDAPWRCLLKDRALHCHSHEANKITCNRHNRQSRPDQRRFLKSTLE